MARTRFSAARSVRSLPPLVLALSHRVDSFDISEMMDSVSALSSWTFMYPSERIAMRKLSNMSVVMNENVM